jgi:hypothetical protein
MPRLQITKKQLGIFNTIVSAYREITTVPEFGRWKKFDNNELWTRHVAQIIVVGSSAGADRFYANPKFAQMVNFETLRDLNGSNLVNNINLALRNAKVRYASSDLKKCMKTRAIVHNFQFINEQKNALLGIIKMFAKLKGEDCEMERVNYFIDNLKFMKNKSARDYLMGIGMNRHTLAIDIRIQNIFEHLGVTFPNANELGNKNVYCEIENKIINAICRPMEIEPIVFDRILYQNYKKILANDFLIPKLF